MSRTTPEVAAVRDAVDELIEVALGCGANWDEPRAPGKWSPSRIVEHVAMALEEGAKDMLGQKSKVPNLPAPLRFLARHLAFKKVIRAGAFPKAKTNPAMNPQSGPQTPGEGRQRLEEAWEVFERAADDAAAKGDTAVSRMYGKVPLADLVRFSELHTRHHLLQMPKS